MADEKNMVTTTGERSRAIFEGNNGASQRQGFLASMYVDGKKSEGRTLPEIQVRYLASGAPLWVQPIGLRNLNWYTKHVDGVSAEGDGESRRWKYTGKVKDEVLEALSGSSRSLNTLAQTMLDRAVASCVERSFTAEQIRNTPVFERYEELGFDLNVTGARKSTKKASTKKTTAAAKSAPTKRVRRKTTA